MPVRRIRSSDRSEWLRMLLGLYPGTAPDDHSPGIDTYFAGGTGGYPPHAAVFVYEHEEQDRLCGFLELSLRNYAEGCSGETPYVESWYVDEDVRGRGVGRALLRAAEEWARDNGYRELASDTELSNGESLQAHLALGFEVVERAVHFRKVLDQ